MFFVYIRHQNYSENLFSMRNTLQKWTQWALDWTCFMLKHTMIFLCLNTMIYAELQKNMYLHILAFFAYGVAHLGMFQYYFGGESHAQAKPPALCKNSPTLSCKLNCVSDLNGTSHLNESKDHVMEKAFTVKVNHDLIVSIKEMKALLWAMNQRLCASKKNSKHSDLSESKSRIEIPALERRPLKRLKCESFHGIENVGWSE